MQARLLIAASLLLAAIPAQAGTILHNLYAIKYCQLRSIGASHSSAMSAAVEYAWISQDTWVYVNYNGRREQSDVVLAVKAAAEECPQYMD